MNSKLLQGMLEPQEATEVVLQIRVVGGSDGTAELLASTQVSAMLPLRAHGHSWRCTGEVQECINLLADPVCQCCPHSCEDLCCTHPSMLH